MAPMIYILLFQERQGRLGDDGTELIHKLFITMFQIIVRKQICINHFIIINTHVINMARHVFFKGQVSAVIFLHKLSEFEKKVKK